MQSTVNVRQPILRSTRKRKAASCAEADAETPKPTTKRRRRAKVGSTNVTKANPSAPADSSVIKTLPSAVSAAKTAVLKPTRGPKTSAGDNAKPRKQSQKQPPEHLEEKRLRVFRKRCPKSFQEIFNRAMTQRMFAIDRTRGGTDDYPEETVELAGTTGNIYTVKINKVPSCNCPHARKGTQGQQCKHIVYVLARVLKAPEHLRYQLAFLSSELRQIFAQAPPIPSANPGSSADSDKRKPIEGDCPICCVEFVPETEDIVYCKTACGNNLHKECFNQWAATKRGHSAVTCPYCRTPWQIDENQFKDIAMQGTLNSDGYVNISRQLGISGTRDYSSYHHFWVRSRIREGRLDP